jgi:hypothetical protein
MKIVRVAMKDNLSKIQKHVQVLKDPDPAHSVINGPSGSGSILQFRNPDSRIRIRKKYLRIHNTVSGLLLCFGFEVL